MLEQCLAQRQEVLGDDHPDTASAMNNLAYCCMAMGDDETAYALLEKVCVYMCGYVHMHIRIHIRIHIHIHIHIHITCMYVYVYIDPACAYV